MTEARDCFERALARLESVPACAEASRVHYSLAYLLFSQRQLDAATKHAQTSLEIARQVGDRRGMADAFRTMGIIANERGEADLSQTHLTRSLGLYRELGDLVRIVQSCNNLGVNHQARGEMDQALSLLQEGLQLAQRIGDTRDEALLLTTTAELYLNQGRWPLAIEHLERALHLAEASGTISRLIEAHWLLGVAHGRSGDLEAAQEHLKKAETQGRLTSFLRYAPRIYLDLARLCATEGKPDQARQHVEQAEAAAGPQPADLFLGHLHHSRGYLAARMGEWDAAIAQFESSLRYLEQAAQIAQVGKTHLELGSAYAQRGHEGDRGHAREHLMAALAILSRIEAHRFVDAARAELKELGGL
jgi:tetratricopeptide (TPR) repeat protein